PALEEPLAGGARLPADEGRAGVESFRGPVLAGLPPPRLPGDVGLWLPGPGTTAREGGPGIAGEKKRRRAEDHGPRGSPGTPATVETDGEAGLQLLQSLSSPVNPAQPGLNGVVLRAARDPGGSGCPAEGPGRPRDPGARGAADPRPGHPGPSADPAVPRAP